MNTSTDARGTLEVAMMHATRLLKAQPELAAEQAREILKVVPKHAPAAFLLARALAAQGHGDDAITALRATLALQPDHPEAWRLLADRGVVVKPKPQFGHGLIHRPPGAPVVVGSYHPSRQNTNTGVLTASMLESVFIRARELAQT